MSVEANKALVRRLYDEVFTSRDFAALDELIAPDFIAHEMPAGTPPGPEGFREYYGWLRSSFPDLSHHVEDLIGEGDRVALRWTLTCTHAGHFMGIAPTGRQVRLTGMAIYRIAGGRCAERWGEMNMLDLLRQLGGMPAAEARSR